MITVTFAEAYRGIRRHSVAVAVAFTIGCISVGPYAYFSLTTPQYSGVTLMGQDAEDHYLARIEEAYDGHGAMGNVFLPYKNTPYLIPGLGEDMVAGLGTMLFLTAPEINVLAKFIFSFLAFVLIYGLARAMTGSRLVGLLGATLAMLGSDFMSYPKDLLYLLYGASAQDGIYWSRPINPEVSGVVLFGCLWLIYRAFIQRSVARWWHIISIALLFGLSVYISPYTWSFLGMLLLVLFGYALWQHALQRALQLALTGMLGAGCAVPFIINYFHATHYPGYAAAALAEGVLANHTPVFGIWVFVLLLVPLVLWPRAEQSSRLFFSTSALALLLLLNQQVLTGVYLQPGHFHWYITKPLVGLMLGVWVVPVAERFVTKRVVRSLGYSAIVAVLMYGAVLAQVRFYTLHAPDAQAAQSYAPLLAYLRGQTQQVVFADEALSTYIPIYTHDDAPGNNYANLYIAPPGYFEALSEIEHAGTLQAPALRALGITTVIQDIQSDPWRVAGLVPKATIAGRFAVYTLGQ